MQDKSESISRHYTQGSLLNNIANALEKAGLSAGSVSVEMLGRVDEFHIGGRAATDHLLRKLQLQPETTILDIGCGIGGTARYVAQNKAVTVKGIDLTPEYVHTGTVLNDWVGLSDKITLFQGSALQTGFSAEHFHCALMLHVGMNIQEKSRLFREIYRLLKPNGQFAIYDIMALTDKALNFPVPWASDETDSFLLSPDRYEDTLIAAGFQIEHVESRAEFAKTFFTRMKEKAASKDMPSPLGLHHIMGADALVKLKNMIDGVLSGVIAPVEIIATKGASRSS